MKKFFTEEEFNQRVNKEIQKINKDISIKDETRNILLSIQNKINESNNYKNFINNQKNVLETKIKCIGVELNKLEELELKKFDIPKTNPIQLCPNDICFLVPPKNLRNELENSLLAIDQLKPLIIKMKNFAIDYDKKLSKVAKKTKGKLYR